MNDNSLPLPGSLADLQSYVAQELALRVTDFKAIPTHIHSGGFKHVFTCEIADELEALKVSVAPPVKDRHLFKIDPFELAKRTRRDHWALIELNKFKCPTIVKPGRIAELIEWKDNMDWQYFVWTEKLLSQSLEAKITEGGYCENDAELRRLLASGALSLHAMQRLEFTHRDIKTSNLSVDFVLFDFGVGHLRRMPRGTMGPIGTPGLTIPPEAVNQFGSAWVNTVQMGTGYDLFGLGVTAYRYCTREGHADSIEPLEIIRPDLDPRLCAIVNRLRGPSHLRKKLNDLMIEFRDDIELLKGDYDLGRELYRAKK